MGHSNCVSGVEDKEINYIYSWYYNEIIFFLNFQLHLIQRKTKATQKSPDEPCESGIIKRS